MFFFIRQKKIIVLNLITYIQIIQVNKSLIYTQYILSYENYTIILIKYCKLRTQKHSTYPSRTYLHFFFKLHNRIYAYTLGLAHINTEYFVFESLMIII